MENTGNCGKPYDCFFGLPQGRIVHSSPNRLAVSVTQLGSPKGRPRLTQQRNAATSASVWLTICSQSVGRGKGYVETMGKETPHGSPPDYHATRRGACLAWGCALPCWTGFERSAPRAIGGSQSLQTSSSVRITNRTSVFRRRHLYRTFSKKRNIRLVRST